MSQTPVKSATYKLSKQLYLVDRGESTAHHHLELIPFVKFSASQLKSLSCRGFSTICKYSRGLLAHDPGVLLAVGILPHLFYLGSEAQLNLLPT
jgi:hypothetical protein